MIAYGIKILQLIKNIKQEIPDITQPWYADDDGALGKLERLEIYFYFLTRQDLGMGYYPNPTKNIVIVRPEEYRAGKIVWGTSRI